MNMQNQKFVPTAQPLLRKSRGFLHGATKVTCDLWRFKILQQASECEVVFPISRIQSPISKFQVLQFKSPQIPSISAPHLDPISKFRISSLESGNLGSYFISFGNRVVPGNYSVTNAAFGIVFQFCRFRQVFSCIGINPQLTHTKKKEKGFVLRNWLRGRYP